MITTKKEFLYRVHIKLDAMASYFKNGATNSLIGRKYNGEEKERIDICDFMENYYSYSYDFMWYYYKKNIKDNILDELIKYEAEKKFIITLQLPADLICCRSADQMRLGKFCKKVIKDFRKKGIHYEFKILSNEWQFSKTRVPIKFIRKEI